MYVTNNTCSQVNIITSTLAKYIYINRWLTIVSITTEEDVVADKVGAPSKVGSFGDEHLLDEREAVDHNARSGSERNAEEVSIDSAQLSEPFKGHLILGQQV